MQATSLERIFSSTKGTWIPGLHQYSLGQNKWNIYQTIQLFEVTWYRNIWSKHTEAYAPSSSRTQSVKSSSALPWYCGFTKQHLWVYKTQEPMAEYYFKKSIKRVQQKRQTFVWRSDNRYLEKQWDASPLDNYATEGAQESSLQRKDVKEHFSCVEFLSYLTNSGNDNASFSRIDLTHQHSLS